MDSLSLFLESKIKRLFSKHYSCSDMLTCYLYSFFLVFSPYRSRNTAQKRLTFKFWVEIYWVAVGMHGWERQYGKEISICKQLSNPTATPGLASSTFLKNHLSAVLAFSGLEKAVEKHPVWWDIFFLKLLNKQTREIYVQDIMKN